MRYAPLRLPLLIAGALLAACQPSPRQDVLRVDSTAVSGGPLPTGVRLDPAGPSVAVGSMPLNMVASPDGTRLVLLLNGYREQGVQVVERTTGRVVQTLPQAAAFIGLAFSPDGRTLYASGGNQDVVYRYAWAEGRATLADSLVLAQKGARQPGTRYPAGVGVSPDGATLYVAENLADSLAVVDVATGRVTQRLATERYPYGVAVAPDGAVYVSAWGGHTVSAFTAEAGGRLRDAGRIVVGRHPSALLLNGDGSRLFVASGSTDRVAVVDTRARRVASWLLDPPPAGPAEGTTPNALALSPDGTRLFVAEADANAVAVFDLSAATSGLSSGDARDSLAGRVPVEWYPTALLALGDSLVVVNGKGRGSGPNPTGPQPDRGRGDPRTYTLGQLTGTITTVRAARASGAELAAYTARVARANHWDAPAAAPSLPPIEHVVYIIKENRTYDQVLGDLPRGDGDSSLVFFPRPVSPNHHALAERFGIYDRFLVNAEVSPDGHNWSTAAYATDYLEKTVPQNYSGRGRTYDYEGTNRNHFLEDDDDDVASPSTGYLWDLALKKGLTLRNYGEYAIPETGFSHEGTGPAAYRATKQSLRPYTNPDYAGFSLSVPDQQRADVWLAELQRYVREGAMPQLEIVRLPNDHTAGARAGALTPRAFMADNDLALGRMIDALSRTPFWRSTAVFVVEDDAQNGADHVDSHRSVLLVISPWARGDVVHRFVNTTDVIATMEELLGLGTMSQFDRFGRPLRDVWRTEPDLRPYTALVPAVSLDERNPANTRQARASERLRLDREDEADEALFNRILWETVKGEDVPYPAPQRMPALDARRE